MAETIYKEPDEIFCPECGRTIKRGASICSHCGANVSPVNTARIAATRNKSKLSLWGDTPPVSCLSGSVYSPKSKLMTGPVPAGGPSFLEIL